jgi:hypothetical protein
MMHSLTDWSDKVQVGRALRRLAGLRRLRVDMRGDHFCINPQCNSLDLGSGGALPGLTRLEWEGISARGAAPELLAVFNSLSGLAELDAGFCFPSWSLCWPATAQDKAGRPITKAPQAPGQPNRRWVLQRELPPSEE